MLQSIIVKEFLETAKEEFEEKWKNPHKVSCVFLYFSVQDFLEKAKKEFEEQWSKNPKVSRKNTGNVFHKLFSTGYISEHISLVLLFTKKSFFEKKNNQ